MEKVAGGLEIPTTGEILILGGAGETGKGIGTALRRLRKVANFATPQVITSPNAARRQSGKRNSKRKRKGKRGIENLKEKMEIRMGDLKMAKLKFVKFPRSFRGVDKDPHRPAQKLATRKSELKNPKLKIAK